MKQWMLALATTHEGDVPLFLRPLDGNRSDKETLASAVEALHEQLHTPDADPSLFVADSGIYSEANMRRFNGAQIRWISRVPETTKEAKAMVEIEADMTEWQDSEDGQATGSRARCRCHKGKSDGSLYAPARQKRVRRPLSSARWTKPNTVGNKSGGTSATSALDVVPMLRVRWLVN